MLRSCDALWRRSASRLGSVAVAAIAWAFASTALAQAPAEDALKRIIEEGNPAYVDWSAQEIAVAAALSGDERLWQSYASGDPYIDLEREAHAMLMRE